MEIEKKNRLEALIRLIHLNLLEFDKSTFKVKIKPFSLLQEIKLSQILQETQTYELKTDFFSTSNFRKHSLDGKQKINVSSQQRPQSSNNKAFSFSKKNPLNQNYETAYKGFRFLSDKMKTKMKNFRVEILKNRIFSASKQNQFSLCYPPSEKLKKSIQADLNIFPMVMLEDYEQFQPKKTHTIDLYNKFYKRKVKF